MEELKHHAPCLVQRAARGATARKMRGGRNKEGGGGRDAFFSSCASRILAQLFPCDPRRLALMDSRRIEVCLGPGRSATTRFGNHGEGSDGACGTSNGSLDC